MRILVPMKPQTFSPAKLREARERQNLSFFDAAVNFCKLCEDERERVTDATIRRWEEGGSEPRARDLARLATVYRASLVEFYEDGK